MTKKRQARFEELRETSKERIESAALELFSKQGYGPTSISQIASAAGISKGLMYNYYESKQALLHAVLKKGFDVGEGLLEESSNTLINDPGGLLRIFIESTFSDVVKHPKYWKLLSSLAFQDDVVKEMAPEIERKKKEHIELGVAIFQLLGHKNPKNMAYYFAASMDGILLQYILSEDDYPLEELKQLLIERFCKKVGL